MRDSKSRFGAQVFSDYSEEAVHFDKIPCWYENEENTVTYRVTREIPANKDDWIGIFRVTIIIKTNRTVSHVIFRLGKFC